jgi:RNA ligase (TIGR02306 family)
MASILMVPVVKITNLREHPKASLLGLSNVLGYQVVVGFVEDPNGPISRWFLKDKRDEKGKRIPVERHWLSLNSPTPQSMGGWVYWLKDKDGKDSCVTDVEEVKFSFQQKEGELIIYFPADTVLTDEWADKFGVKSLLKGGNRVGKIALRGEPSFGLVVPIPEDKRGIWKEGDNVAEFFSAKKYEPPIKTTAGDAAPRDAEIDPFFDKFTDIQNLRIFVDIFKPGEEVIVTEKIEGTNSRLGWINSHMVAGSMELRRSRPSKSVEGAADKVEAGIDDFEMKRNTYWFPWTILAVSHLLDEMSKNNKTVELFGEVYGGSIQKGFKYDAGGGIGFRAFGLKVGDKFLDWDEFEGLCSRHGVPVVPVLYRGAFDMGKVLALAEGPTTLGEAPLREGIVVYPVKERIDPRVGRTIAKVHGYGYELLKGRADSKDV